MTMLIDIIYKTLLYSYPERYTLLKIVLSLSSYTNYIIIFLLMLLSCKLYYNYTILYNSRLKEIKTNDLFTFINKFKITNIYLIILNVFIYIFGTFIIILIIRLTSLGNTYTINVQNITIISYSKIFLLIIFIVFTYLLHIYLDLLLFDDVIRLYIYSSKRLYPIFRFIYDNRFFITMKYLGVIRSGLHYILQNKASRKIVDDRINVLYPNLTKKRLLNILSSYVERIPLLYYIFYYLEKVFLKIDLYINPLLKDLPLIALIMILLLDISKGNIYYLYYGLLLFLIIKLYSKLTIFIWGLDLGGLDFILHDYLYTGPDMSNILENDKRYKQLSLILDNNNINTNEFVELYRIQLKKSVILEVIDDLTIYLLNGLKRKDIIIEGDPGLLRLNVTRKFIILIFSLLSFFYIYFQCQLTIQINSLFGTTNISLIILCLLVYCYNNKNKYYTILYWFISLNLNVDSIILYYNRINIYMNETIWDYGIKITQTFSIDEKLEFIYQYIVYTIKYTKGMTIDQKLYFINILTNIKYKDLITDVTTIIQLREYIDSLLPTYQRLETAYIYSRIHIYKDTLITNIDTISTIDITLILILTSTLATCIYILPPVFLFIDAYIKITNPKFHVILVFGKSAYRSFKQILRTNYPDYFDH